MQGGEKRKFLQEISRRGSKAARSVVWGFFLFFWMLQTARGEQNSPMDVGIEEKLGEYVPLDVNLFDEEGNTITLGEFLNKPAVVVLVYYTCPGICSVLLSGVAEVLNKMKESPGTDYTVLSISFDPMDTPSIALQKKREFLSMLSKKIPEKGWRFLTADAENIQKLTQAVGFHFQKIEGGFLHPSALVFLSPQGKIVRYLYGTSFLPFDIQMGITEASEGRVGFSVRRILKFCYSYDPESRKYVLNITQISGTVILLLAGSFFVFLAWKGTSRKEKMGG